MELQEFTAKFADLFEDTDPSEITSNCVFSELDEWDSLATLSVIALIKTEYGKNISANDIRICNTVEDLYHLAEK